ncbi:AAA family ATPase, partial [Desulfuromonas thiophila]
MTALKKLPIGIQTFSEIRQEGYLYVDKTPQVRQLVEQGKYY